VHCVVNLSAVNHVFTSPTRHTHAILSMRFTALSHGLIERRHSSHVTYSTILLPLKRSTLNRQHRHSSWNFVFMCLKNQTRNVWQSLAYSPLDAIVLPPSEYQWKHLLIAALPSNPAPYWTYTWSHPRKIFDADCTTSYVLNSGVTDPIVTEFLHDVQNWLPITSVKSKLRSSNPFQNARLTNEVMNEDLS